MEQRRHGFTSMLLPWEFCARLSSTFGPNGPATSHIVGLCILAIQDDVAVRRMEEIDVDVLYEAWKRIEITKASNGTMFAAMLVFHVEDYYCWQIGLLRLCICEYVMTIGCWNGNVVIDLDFGGAAWNHVCSHAVFDASLSIQPCSVRLSMVVEIDLYVSLASLDCLCSHCGFYFCGTIAFAGIRIGAATRVRACSHAVLYDADAVGETHTQSSGKEISMNETVVSERRYDLVTHSLAGHYLIVIAASAAMSGLIVKLCFGIHGGCIMMAHRFIVFEWLRVSLMAMMFTDSSTSMIEIVESLRMDLSCRAFILMQTWRLFRLCSETYLPVLLSWMPW
ncbi:hypothetical protein Tco_1561934 [Tanacetum coccineum]